MAKATSVSVDTIRPIKEVLNALLHDPYGSAFIDLRGNTYVTVVRGEHATDPTKDVLGILFYGKKKAGKLNLIGKLLIDRKSWKAFKATGDMFFEFPYTLRLKSQKKPKPRRSSRKKR